MNTQWRMIVIFGVLAVIMSCVLWRMNRAMPVLSKSETDLDNTIIGDSATDNHDDGPAYMGANWAWPMPLAFWNPATTARN